MLWLCQSSCTLALHLSIMGLVYVLPDRRWRPARSFAVAKNGQIGRWPSPAGHPVTWITFGSLPLFFFSCWFLFVTQLPFQRMTNHLHRFSLTLCRPRSNWPNASRRSGCSSRADRRGSPTRKRTPTLPGSRTWPGTAGDNHTASMCHSHSRNKMGKFEENIYSLTFRRQVHHPQGHVKCFNPF